MFSGKTVFFSSITDLPFQTFFLIFWRLATNKAFKIKFVFVHFTYSYFQMFSLSSAAFASTGNYKVSKYQWIKMSSWLCIIPHRLYFQGIQRVQINDWVRQTEEETLTRSEIFSGWMIGINKINKVWRYQSNDPQHKWITRSDFWPFRKESDEF